MNCVASSSDSNVCAATHALALSSRLVFYVALARDSSYYIYRFVLSAYFALHLFLHLSVLYVSFNSQTKGDARSLSDMFLLMLMGVALVFLRANEPDRECA
jgi:hypothetical protein